MIILRIACILAITAAPIRGVLNNGGGPAQVYGPPPGRVPHREYGVPQQIPFREYGPPSLKYGPPKLNVNFGQNFQGGFNDQVKTHFGIPRPFYGPPHLQNRPNGFYGPPPPQGKPFPNFGPPGNSYGPPRPAATYGPPLPQPLPLVQPGPAFKPGGNGFISRPHTSYGPPPSGQFINKPNLNFRPPNPSYGPPPLPNLNRLPETTIILTSNGIDGGVHNNLGPQGGPVKQVQIQVESQGNGHSGSNGHFHTASCDGWKPIPAPVGQYVEQNSIQTQSGYSSVVTGSDQSLTQYNNGNANVGGLTDEQLVAVALQSGSFETAPTQSLPAAGPVDFHSSGGSAGGVDNNQLNSIESEALQISLASIEDSYSKPPQDSFAPNSAYAQKYNTISGNGGQDLVPPSGAYGPPPPSGGGNFQSNFIHHSEGGSSYSSQSGNLGILYGTQTGNQRPWLNNGLLPPSNPVTYRPPVPQGLLESIGQTVQHLDQFGVKPLNQPSTYIPPPPKEIAEPSNQYGPPQPQHPLPASQQSIKIEFQQQGAQQYLPPPPPPPHPVAVPIQQQQYFPPPRSSHHYQGGNNNFATSFGQQFVHTQGLPLTQEARFNQPQDCGHGPNLVGANYQLQQQLPQPTQFFQEQNIGQPADNYGPPPAPTGSGLDIVAYESKQSSVTSLPDNINSDNLPGLDGLNVISAQKSQSVPISVQNQQTSPFHIQIQSSGPGAESSTLRGDGPTNHDEVLSEGLLQSILTAIEQPQNNNQLTTPQLQNRSDNDVHPDDNHDSKESSSGSTKTAAASTKPVSAENDDAKESK